MIRVVPRKASNAAVLGIVKDWVEVLARQDYQAVFESLGYLISFGDPSADSIRNAIRHYRSPEYYPGVSTFVVTDWRTARGGNPEPKSTVTWFKTNSVGMVAAVAFDLPLNGQWSDLTADFVMFEGEKPDGGHSLRLEEIHSWKQVQREIEAQERGDP
jgi:hypothetical protein